jgi:chemotaxis signal transduction protein
MNVVKSRVAGRAEELRVAFDRAFAAPQRVETKIREELLAIRLGPQPCALRLSEIAGLFADKKITPIPGGHAALLGIAGFRGAILPVYDLQILLRYPSDGRSRWLVIAAAAPVALAFDAFERQLRVPRNAIMPQPARPDTRTHAREFVRTRKFTGPILHLPSVLDAIKAWRPEATSPEER